MEINYSFIIPHKNSLRLLERCLKSIPEREDVEIIIADDNSADSEKPYIARTNCTIEYIDAIHSKGAGHARNVGINKARGKWILFPDADDYYVSDVLQKLDCHNDSSADVIYFNHNKIKNGEIKSTVNNSKLKHIEDQEEVEKLKFKIHAPWNKMVKREFLTEKKIFFEETSVGNDIFFSYQIGFFAQMIEIDPTHIYNYVINSNSITHKRKNSENFYIDEFNHLYQCNEFYKFIKRPKWQKSLIRKLASIIIKRGAAEFIFAIKILLSRYSEIKSNKMKLVEGLTNTK